MYVGLRYARTASDTMEMERLPMPALVHHNERHKNTARDAHPETTLPKKLARTIRCHHLAQTPKHITVPCFDAFSEEPKQICIPTVNVYIYVSWEEKTCSALYVMHKEKTVRAVR